MSADEITTISVAASAAIGGMITVLRFVLLVGDALDERYPVLKRITNPLGRFLGGDKARYSD